jgi:hypothetical protein
MKLFTVKYSAAFCYSPQLCPNILLSVLVLVPQYFFLLISDAKFHTQTREQVKLWFCVRQCNLFLLSKGRKKNDFELNISSNFPNLIFF